MKKPLIYSLFITLFILLPSLLALGQYSGPNRAIIPVYSTAQTESAIGLEDPPLIKENTVVFYSISQEDFDELIKDPDRRQDTIEAISDFKRNALWVAEKLEDRGIAAVFVSDKEIWFELPTGIIEKRRFDPKNEFQLALFPKGKPPLIVRSRSSAVDDGIIADYDSLLKAISDYFEISPNQSNINWDEIRRAFGSYCQSPSSEKATWILSIIPEMFDSSKANQEEWKLTLDYLDMIDGEPFRVLEKLIRKGDESAIRVGFKTHIITDGAVSEDLLEILSEAIRANTPIFLEELSALRKRDEHSVDFLLRRDSDIDTYTLFDDPQAREEFNKEIVLRMRSLRTVSRPDLIEIRDYCLRYYERLLKEGK